MPAKPQDSKDKPERTIRLRPETFQDEEFLFEVYAGTRREEMDATGWDSPTRRAFLTLQFRAMRQAYASAFPTAESAILMHGDHRIGRVVVDRSSQVIHVVDIALLPEFRGRGYGTAFLRTLINEAVSARQPLRLRVYRGSRAAQLYRRLGFRLRKKEEPFELLEWQRDEGQP